MTIYRVSIEEYGGYIQPVGDFPTREEAVAIAAEIDTSDEVQVNIEEVEAADLVE